MTNEIKEYLKEHAVWCSTLQEAEDFIDFIDKKVGLKTSVKNVELCWKRYEETISFSYANDRVGYSYYTYYLTRWGRKIVPFKEFKSKFMEETMNPEKEASKCQDETFEEKVRKIAEEVYDKKLGEYNYPEPKEPEPELTQKENNILKGLHYLGWSWIARDEVEGLTVYEKKPMKASRWWLQNTNDECAQLEDVLVSKIFNTNALFTFVSVDDKEPTLIANLIDWGDDE